MTLPMIDALLAASAKVHNLTRATRNEDFELCGAVVFNPWEP